MSEALELSIQKWENIVMGLGEDKGADNCALCVEFLKDMNDCKGCPVEAKTQQMDCINTPYHPWRIHHRQRHQRYPSVAIACLTCVYLAQDELDFLKSLRKD